MANFAIKNVCKDTEDALIAVHLAAALERVVQAGINLSSRRGLSQKRLRWGLEEKAVPIIRGVLKILDPEEFRNVRRIGTPVIWGVYWNLRKDGRKFPFFKLLIELNRNPVFNSFFL